MSNNRLTAADSGKADFSKEQKPANRMDNGNTDFDGSKNRLTAMDGRKCRFCREQNRLTAMDGGNADFAGSKIGLVNT